MKLLLSIVLFLLILHTGYLTIKGILTIWRHGAGHHDEFPENLAFFCVLLSEFCTHLMNQTVNIPLILILYTGIYLLGKKIRILILNKRAEMEL